MDFISAADSSRLERRRYGLQWQVEWQVASRLLILVWIFEFEIDLARFEPMPTVHLSYCIY